MKRQDATFTPVRFSSDDLPERERLPIWREFWGRSIFGAEIEPIRDAPFHADVTARFLPDVGLLNSSFSPIRISCVPAMADGVDDSIGLVIASGDFTVRRNGREIEVMAGDAVAMATSDAATLLSHSSALFRCALVNRTVLAPFLPDLDDAIMRPLPQRSQPLRYLLSYIQFIEENGQALSLQLAQSVSLHLCELFALALGPRKDAAIPLMARGLRAAQLEAIKRYISRHCNECQLTVRTIASHFHMTPRRVQRLFETDGTTSSKFLLETRLAQVGRMLTDPSCNGSSISAVALQAGFGDISYFNRCFRRQFGASPTEFRNSAGPRKTT